MIRIVRGLPGTLTLFFVVDDELTDLDAPPTVAVTRVGGSQIAAGTSTRTGLGTYTYALAPQADVTALVATWTGELDAVDVTATTYAEIVGGEYFNVGELRNSDAVMLNTTKYPTPKLRIARMVVEAEFEGICGRAFVPRYAREVIIGNGCSSLWLSNPDAIRVLSLTVDDEDWADRAVTRPADNLRVLDIEDGRWPNGSRIVIEYEHGMSEVPIRIKTAAMKRAKYMLVADQSRIDERAVTMNVPDFGNFVLATPGMRGSHTGIPEVDVVLQDYELGKL